MFLLHWVHKAHFRIPILSSSSLISSAAVAPPSLMFPSAEELQVELTLLELADLILERRRIPPPGGHPGSLRWRGEKPRSVASRRRRRLWTPSPPPPLDGKEGDAAAAAAATAASSSPTTPLSFQESGSEEAGIGPDPEAEHSKRRREVSLPPPSGGEGGVLLTEARAEHGKRRWKLIAREDRKSSSVFSYQTHQAKPQQREISVGGGAMGPAFQAWVRPTGGGHREQQSVGAVAGLPDLNVCAAEEEEQQQDPVRRRRQQRQQQLMAYRAATSLARRRRVQILREKRFSLLPYNSR